MLVLASLTGCQSVSIQRVGRSTTGPIAVPMQSTAGFPASPEPPAIDSAGNPATTLDPLPAMTNGDLGTNQLDPTVLLIEAEKNRLRGVSSYRASRPVAARFELTAVGQALAALEASRAEPLPETTDESRIVAARAEYAAALRDFLRDSSNDRVHLDSQWQRDLAAEGFRVQFDREASTWTPGRFDEFLFTDDYKVTGLQHEYKYPGIGVPLVGVRRFRFNELDKRQGEAKYLLPREVYPVTAVLQPRRRPARSGDGVELAGFHPEAVVTAAIPPVPTTEYTLELHDPIVERRVEFQGRSEPLAADLSTSLTYRFANRVLPILQEVGLLDPQSLEKLAGLYMVHPYIPGRVPVVFVHGLRSSPAAWIQVMNEIRGDANLRDRYQVWLFMYPTGTPFPYSAAKLRAQLNELRAVVDPEHADRALDNVVLVGHSMGGLITRLMISESGPDLWKLVSNRPFEELRATPERKEMLRNVFFFEPHPMITRAVFIATPHRGSELGDQFIGRVADRLIRLPSSLRQTYRALLVQNGRDFFTPEVRSGLPSSIDELRRDNRLLMAMSRLPIRPGLEAHSIIGRKNPPDPIPQSTDGVVPYASSHIDWATTEKVVAGDHGCEEVPETIDELRQILTNHLGRMTGNQDDPEVHRASMSAALTEPVEPANPKPRRPHAWVVESPKPDPQSARDQATPEPPRWRPVRP